jgi:hypothetical protein
MHVDYEHQLLSDFYGSDAELRARVKAFIVAVNLNTCEHLEAIIAALQRWDGDPAARDALTKVMRVRVHADNRALMERGDGLLDEIRQRVDAGIPYMGASAGSNVAGLSICTTNDMPIVYPPSFDALGLVPFNINPHYIDPEAGSKHMGETRETRINEFHVFSDVPVIGIREGAMLHREGGSLRLAGSSGGILFRPGVEVEELAPGTVLDSLL